MRGPRIAFHDSRLDQSLDFPHDSARVKNKAASIFVILAAAFAVYWPSLHNGFVWDDTALVLLDPLIRSWRLIPDGFNHFLFTDATAANFYRPLQRLTFTADYAIYGFVPWGYHLTNLILHALAGVALFFFLTELISQFQGSQKVNAARLSLLSSLLWVIHPVHNAAVIYVSGRADLLAALFGFTGLYLALRKHSWGAALCFLAALLSKESGIASLLTWLCIMGFKQIPIRRWLFLLPLIGLFYFGLRGSAEKTPVPQRPPMSLSARPVLMARALGEYAGLLIAPVNLHMERDLTGVGWEGQPGLLQQARLREYQTLLGVLLAIGFVLWMRWTKRSSQAGWICLLGFLIAYLPISNLFTLNATAAEHWLYVPSAYLIAALLLSLATLRFSTPAFAVIYGVWFLFFGIRTFQRNPDWKDQKTFVLATIADGGDSARMLVQLGMIETAEGHPENGLSLFKEAFRRTPGQPMMRLNLAKAYLRLGDLQKARQFLMPCLESDETRAQALLDLTALEFKETGRRNLDYLRQASELSPNMWSVRRRYILGFVQTGNLAGAITELRGLLDQQPYRAESWHLLGDLLQKAGERDLSRRAYAQAADYDVHDDKARELAR